MVGGLFFIYIIFLLGEADKTHLVDLDTEQLNLGWLGLLSYDRNVIPVDGDSLFCTVGVRRFFHGDFSNLTMGE